MNDAYLLAPWVDLLYACDLRWWAKRRPGDPQVGGVWVSQDPTACERYGLAYVASATGTGLCRTPWTINQGLNSGYQTLNLAYHLGANRVVLLGYDMKVQPEKSHFFGDYPRESGLQVPSPYTEFIRRFRPLASDLAAEGIEVLNCSPDTALDCFPLRRIEECL